MEAGGVGRRSISTGGNPSPEQQTWKDPEFRQSNSAAALFVAPDTKGAIARVWFAPDRMVRELVRIHALQSDEMEAVVCAANAAWTLDRRGIPPTMAMDAIVGETPIDGPWVKTVAAPFSLSPAWTVLNANRAGMGTVVPHWLPVGPPNPGAASPSNREPTVFGRRDPRG